MVALHLFSMFFSLGVIFAADKEALAWMRGKKTTLRRRRMLIYHILTWTGLSGLIVSGTMLFLPMRSFLLSQPLFIMKLLFVAVLIVNGILIGRFASLSAERSFASLSWDERMPLFVSGAVSSFSWLGAVVLALILFKM